MISAANPYLNFPGNTEEAFGFYRGVFGGDFEGVMRYRDFPDNSMGVADADLDKIAHIALPLGPGMLMGTDVVGERTQALTMGTNTYIALSIEDAGEAHRVFDGLSAGGRVDMPLQPVEWSDLYGIAVDRYGVQWMVDHTGSKQFTLPKAG